MLKTFSATDVGRFRQLNQDYVYASEEPVGNLPNLFIVADGMGGHKAGDFASSFSVKQVVESIGKSDSSNPIKVIRTAIEKANLDLIEEAKKSPEKSGMGTTIVVATVVERYLYVANVGDSRLYLVGDTIAQITRDHSLVEEMVRAGKLGKKEARLHPDKNIITRAIGATEDLMVDFFDLRLREGDTILMCSDGLSNMVDDADILRIMNEHSGVEEKTRALIRQANENGGKDNIAVVVVEPFG